MTIRNLDALFKPQSVAVIGASSRPGSLGAIVWQRVLAVTPDKARSMFAAGNTLIARKL